MAAHSTLAVGSLLFPGVDQIDLTGPFEVLSRIPGAQHRIYGTHPGPVRDVNGLRLLPDAPYRDAPRLDLLHVPGGPGQEDLMHDPNLHTWLREQAGQARLVFAVCTGALLLGAAGLLAGRRATTHWMAHDLLPLFGAEAVDARVVVDGDLVTAAGVTAGIDGALTVAARLVGEEAAQAIQLDIVYAPEPPFAAGTPQTAPPSVLADARRRHADLRRRREVTARAYAASSPVTRSVGST